MTAKPDHLFITRFSRSGIAGPIRAISIYEVFAQILTNRARNSPVGKRINPLAFCNREIPVSRIIFNFVIALPADTGKTSGPAGQFERTFARHSDRTISGVNVAMPSASSSSPEMVFFEKLAN